MENFILWNISYDKSQKLLSWFALSVNVPQIHEGTEEMVSHMLQDLGLTDIAVEKWKVNHFVTNYLTDDADSNDWRDVWINTWEIQTPSKALKSENLGSTELIRTYAIDKSWKKQSSFLPAECVVIADFYSASTLKIANQAFGELRTLSEDTSQVDKLHKRFPDLPKTLLSDFQKIYQTHQPTTSLLSIRLRESYPQQLILSLGPQGENFFKEGAKLATIMAEICRKLNGTTTWRERTSPKRLGRP